MKLTPIVSVILALSALTISAAAASVSPSVLPSAGPRLSVLVSLLVIFLAITVTLLAVSTGHSHQDD